MRLNLILPKVEPTEFEFPKKRPRKGCPGMRFTPRQAVSKKIVDAQHPEVTAWRCECQKCGYVFRVYPKGVSQKHISRRVNGMAVMLSPGNAGRENEPYFSRSAQLWYDKA